MSYKIDIRKLSTFNSMAKEGAKNVANNLEMMLGEEIEMRITQTNFVQPQDIENKILSNLGVEVSLYDPPYGYLLLAFDERDAEIITDMMLSGQDIEKSEVEGLGEMEMSAIKEAGNIVASGFIDGWADILDTTIDITTPEFTEFPATDAIKRIEEDLAIIFSSHLYTSDSEIEINIYVFPELEPLVDLIESLKMEE